jgi:hypothetical protein
MERLDGEELFDLFTAQGVTREEVARLDLATVTLQVGQMRDADPFDDLEATDEEIAQAILEFAQGRPVTR